MKDENMYFYKLNHTNEILYLTLLPFFLCIHLYGYIYLNYESEFYKIKI